VHALVLAVLAAGCGDDGPDDEATEDRPAVTVRFSDGGLHTFTSAERAAVVAVAEGAVAEVRALLPELAPSITVEVSAGSTVIPETGEVGAAATPEVVRWVVDPARPGGVEQVARTQLRSTLFHELHHAVRGHVFSNRDTPDSFMDSVISEGMASVFERDFAGDREVLWAQYPDDVAAWVDELLALPVDADYGQWMFDHADGRRWVGYRAGAYLVDRAMERSGRTSADLVRTPPSEVLELAGHG
jgi:uncharacterized protein YjaZ